MTNATSQLGDLFGIYDVAQRHCSSVGAALELVSFPQSYTPTSCVTLEKWLACLNFRILNYKMGIIWILF